MGNIPIDQMASEIMKGLTEYADLATDEMKTAVKKAGKTVKEGIKSGAPRDSGRYASSWTTKATHENANSLEVTVYSPKRYQIAHLLEHGHAKRGGGRVKAYPHIAPAEELGENQLLADIERALK